MTDTNEKPPEEMVAEDFTPDQWAHGERMYQQMRAMGGPMRLLDGRPFTPLLFAQLFVEAERAVARIPTATVDLRVSVAVDLNRAFHVAEEFHCPDLVTLVRNEVLGNLESQKYVVAVSVEAVAGVAGGAS